MELIEKHILVTGAAKRVGRVIAEHLLNQGEKLKLSAHYRNSTKEIKELVAWAESKGHQANAIQADLREVVQTKLLADQAVKKFGPVDILINSASDFYPTPDATEEQWEDLINVNLKGPFFLSQSILKTMKKGVILNITDVNGERPMRRYTPYVISKAGLLMLTRNLALENAPHIRVNSISPGPVLLPPTYTEEQKQRSIDRTLLKRLGTPEAIAQAVLFLIANEYITGIDLRVDGGRSLA